MTVWMSEKEFRQGGAEAVGVTINVAFLQEIKEDFGFRKMLNDVYQTLHRGEKVHPRIASEMLSGLRDELETYFALEEFYGYFDQSAEQNPAVSKKAYHLRSDHEKLYLQFNDIVEKSEQIVYHECPEDFTVRELCSYLDQFCMALADHEQSEMELMMRLVNEDIGVGD